MSTIRGEVHTASASNVNVSITRNVLTGCDTSSGVRSITDGVLTNGSTTLTSNSANFTNSDRLAVLSAPGIPTGTTIESVTNSTTVIMSAAATTTGSGVAVTIADIFYQGYSVVQSVPNQGTYDGGNDNTWIGCGGGRSHWDFLIQNNGSIRIFGGRWEGNNGINQVYQGNRFLQASTMPDDRNYNVLIEGVTIDGYNEPTDYPGVFVLNGATTLRLVSCNIIASNIPPPPPGYMFSSNFINAQGSWNYTSITIEDCNIQALTPFWTLKAGQVTAVNLRNVQLTPAHPSLIPASIINMVDVPPVTLTDNPGGTVTIDTTQGNYFILPMTGGSNSRTLAFANAQPG